MGLASSVLRVSSLTSVSRVAGFVRTVFFAYLFGSSSLFDAFVVAFKIPNLFRRLFSEGAINTSIIPILASLKKGAARQLFLRELFGLYSIGLGILVALGIVFAPQLIELFYLLQGTKDAEATAAASTYLRVMFGYLLVISFAALCQGALNAEERFGVPAATPILFNLALIASCVLAWRSQQKTFDQLYWVSVGVLAGGVLQFAAQVPSLARQGYSIVPRFQWFKNPAMRRFLRLMLPVVVASGTYQLNIFLLDPIALSLEEGTVSVLHYSSRLLELPLGVVGISLTTVGLPLLSKSLARSKQEEFRSLLGRLVRIALVVMVPIVVFSVMQAGSVVRLLFEGGVFGSREVSRTAECFAAHALGLPAIAVARIFNTALIAMQMTRPLVWTTLASVAANLAAALLLTKVYSFSALGLALAGSLAALVGMLLSGILLFRSSGTRQVGAMVVAFTKASVAAVMAAVVLVWLQFGLSQARDLLDTWESATTNAFLGKAILFGRFSFALVAFGLFYLAFLWLLNRTFFRRGRK